MLVLVSGHNHSSHPEENDIGGCNQIGGRVIVVYFFVAGIVDTIEKRDGP